MKRNALHRTSLWMALGAALALATPAFAANTDGSLVGRASAGAQVLSTHMSVVDFLAMRGTACSDVSEFVTPEEAGA